MEKLGTILTWTIPDSSELSTEHFESGKPLSGLPVPRNNYKAVLLKALKQVKRNFKFDTGESSTLNKKAEHKRYKDDDHECSVVLSHTKVNNGEVISYNLAHIKLNKEHGGIAVIREEMTQKEYEKLCSDITAEYERAGKYLDSTQIRNIGLSLIDEHCTPLKPSGGVWFLPAEKVSVHKQIESLFKLATNDPELVMIPAIDSPELLESIKEYSGTSIMMELQDFENDINLHKDMLSNKKLKAIKDRLIHTHVKFSPLMKYMSPSIQGKLGAVAVLVNGLKVSEKAEVTTEPAMIINPFVGEDAKKVEEKVEIIDDPFGILTMNTTNVVERTESV